MTKRTSAARQQRRTYEKFLKKYHPEQYRDYKSGVIERGRKTHEQNVESIRKSEEEYFEKLQTEVIQRMKSEGKTNEEIDEYIADWVNTLKVWGSSVPPMTWRKIRKEKRQTEDDQN